MSFKTGRRIAYAVVAVMLLGAVGWSYTVWYECRISGHSFAYCAKLVAR